MTLTIEVVHRFPDRLAVAVALHLPAAGPPGAAIAHAGPVRARPVPRPSSRSRPTMFTLLDDQKTTLRANPVDAAGNPAGAFAGPPGWSVDDPSVLALTPSADGLACDVTTTGKLGTATVTLTAPPFVAGGPPLTDSFPVTVSADVAAGTNITADAPVSRLAPAVT